MTSAPAKPFSFDELDPAPQAEPVAKTYSHEELEQATQQAHADAIAEAQTGELAAQTALLEQIASTLSTARAEYNNAAAQNADALNRGAGTIVRKFCEKLAAAREVKLASALIDRFVNASPEKTPAVLKLPESADESVIQRLNTLLNIRDLASFISVEQSAGVADASCRLEWRGGALARNLQDSLDEIDSIFAPQMADADKETEQ